MNLIIATILFLCWPSILVAEIYKWVDENGRTHFSEFPPQQEEIKVETIHEKKHQPIEPASRGGIERYNQYLESERLERKEKRLQKQQQQEKLQNKCNQLRRRLSDFQTGGVVYYDLDESGNRVYWSDQKLTQIKDRLNRQIQQNCKG